MSKPASRRYPGAHSFEDSALGRALFFGRKEDSKNLLDTILAEQLVVLYAKSGAGKTSLLNAGVKQALRDQNFLPLVARVNGGAGPLDAVFEGIAQAAREQGVEHTAGSQQSLWYYFKTVEFWRGDVLLTPVLILDQFEELFTLHGGEGRRQFIEQLADLVRGRRFDPDPKRSETAVSDAPPVVKVVLGIREDYLTALEELATLIPGILRTRFRLRPLGRAEARSAIEDPARVRREELGTPQFRFTPGTVDALLDLLAAKPSASLTGSAAVEPFQLQLICQHVEELVRERAKNKSGEAVTISLADLGGEAGFHRIIRDFYERQLDEVGQRYRRGNLERLCERGLVNALGKRLSEEENEIERQFGVPKKALEALAEARVLRSEPRLDSTFYELSHDMLVEPVRNARLERQRRRNRRWRVAAALAVVLGGGWWLWNRDTGSRRRQLVIDAGRARALGAKNSEAGLMAAVAAMDGSLRLGGVPEVSTALTALLNQPTVTSAALESQPARATALSPNGRLVALATAGGIELRDRGGRAVGTIAAGDVAGQALLIFSRDGDALALAEGARLRAWEISGRPLIPEARLPDRATALVFSPEGDVVLAPTADRQICSVGADGARCSGPFALDADLVHLAFLHNHRLLGLTRSGSVFEWRVDGRQFSNFAPAFAVQWTGPASDFSADGAYSAAIYGRSVLLWRHGTAQPRQLRVSGSSEPTALAFSPRGDRLAVGTNQGQVSTFVTATGEPAAPPVDTKAGNVAALAWTPEGRLAVGGASGLAFPLGAIKPERACGAGGAAWDSYKSAVTALAFLPDGSLLSADRAGIKLWGAGGALCARGVVFPLGRDAVRPRFYIEYRLLSMAAVPHSDPAEPLFLTGDNNDKFQVWRVTGDIIQLASTADSPTIDIEAISVDAGGSRVTTTDALGSRRTWGLRKDNLTLNGPETPPEIHIFTDKVTALESDGSASIFAWTDGGILYLYQWTEKSFQQRQRLAVHTGPLAAAHFSPAARMLVSAGTDGTVETIAVAAYDLNDPVDVRVPAAHPADVAVGPAGDEVLLADAPRLFRVRRQAARFTEDYGGDRVAVARGRDTVVTLNADSHRLALFAGQPLSAIEAGESIDERCNPTAFAVAPDARRIVVGCEMGRLAILTDSFDSLAPPVSLFAARPVASNADEAPEMITAVDDFGSFFAAGSSRGRLALWTGDGGKLADAWPVASDRSQPVTAVEISPDGRVAISGTEDGDLDAWRVDRAAAGPARLWEKHERRGAGVTSIAFAAGGTVFAGFTDGAVREYAAKSGQEAGNFLIDLKQPNVGLTRVAVSPDGRRILTTTSDGAIQFWDRSGNPISEPIKVAADVSVDAAFTSDGASVVVSRAELAGPILPGSPEAWLADACDRLRYSAALFGRGTAEGAAARAACVNRVWAKEGGGAYAVAASDRPELAQDGGWRGWFQHGPAGAASPLERAAASGRIAAVQALLAGGAEKNARDSEGRTALAAALRAGYSDVALLLEGAGADSRIADAAGDTPLAAAAAQGLAVAANRLIELGTAADVRDQDGVTPLMMASWYGQTPAAAVLLKRGASPDAADRFGRTALIEAAKADNPDVTQMLMDRHADVNRFDGSAVYGRSAMLWATAFQHPEIASVLAAGHPRIVNDLPDAVVRLDPRVVPAPFAWTVPKFLACQGGSLAPAEARQFLQTLESAARSDPDAEFLAGWAYGLGCGAAANAGTARARFEEGARRGSALAQAAYGVSLDMGFGGEQDLKAAQEAFRQSAARGNAFGQWLMVRLASDEDAKKKDYQQALADAARTFAPAAATKAFSGALSPESELPPERAAEIARLNRLAAAAGDVGAANVLALWQRNGLRQFADSVRTLRAAASAPERMILWPGAHYSYRGETDVFLGFAYEFGLGVERSPEDAARWYGEGAHWGEEMAAKRMGVLYEWGIGVPASLSKAVAYYRQGAAGGDPYCMNRLTALRYAP